MNGKLITTAEGILVFRDPNAPKIQNHSEQLLQDLLNHYHIPRNHEERDLTQNLAFLLRVLSGVIHRIEENA